MSRISTLLRGAAATTVAAAALPLLGGAADAATSVTCTFDKAAGVVRIDVKGIESSVVLERSMDERLLVNADLCTASDDTVADLANIGKVAVRGGPSEQAVVIDLDGGPFTPGRGDEPGGSDEIEFDIALGADSDHLEIRAYDAGSSLRAGTKNGAHVVNLNPTEKAGVDADVTMRGVEAVTFEGAMGDDHLSGAGGRGTGQPLALRMYVLDVAGGDDRLIGGARADQVFDPVGGDVDVLRGGAGVDNLESYDGDSAADVIDGQAGSDVCHYDPADTAISCESTPPS